MKPPQLGKSRLRGAPGCPPGEQAHARLVLALAADTLAAARAAAGVRRVLVVGTDPATLAELDVPGVEVVGENGAGGLNAALRHGESVLRAGDPDAVVAAMQADLPALRAVELSSAIEQARGRRAFVADRHGSGTTLLLSAPGGWLGPRFGTGSAQAHARSGALALAVRAPSLRGDVDTPEDLRHASELGLGERSKLLLAESCCLR
ncbi:2-phospho-L-lactate guanylyltransferase [Amycolatopsis antarctica]|uniref:2-phospho-L-lactate guanylyltransferase n=1 Tax=Amycolatopsis antarctica TaxID=1854586 RepID=A0A263D7P6_9PSEU|nr:2-phospho-L-lactate guanylyltransferase [Amycolatopsis antarctica]OZM74199.1 2-phospho-L-lactate guanylyltransferase [Amycolatopsis antarctica]